MVHMQCWEIIYESINLTVTTITNLWNKLIHFYNMSQQGLIIPCNGMYINLIVDTLMF